MPQNYSKPLIKTEDDGKKLIKNLLDNIPSYFMDIDQITYSKFFNNDSYQRIILELLKCESVVPERSHPSRYWFKNKTKFLILWRITKDVKGRLILLNYNKAINKPNFKGILFEILDMDENGIKKQRYITPSGYIELDFDIEKQKKFTLSFEQLRSIFLKVNKFAQTGE